MDKSFDPRDIESRWYPRWEASGCFAPQGEGEPYTIMLPPPNVTGTLHMGHAFQHTIMDTLIRYQRMCGKRTLWQLGTDHAGIATEMVVSRLLEREGQTRNALGREQFVERVWQWKEESGSTISRQMRRMGVSGDWSRERFTMDEGLSKAVVETFVQLHAQGLIYRGQRLTIPGVAPTPQQALSLAERWRPFRMWIAVRLVMHLGASGRWSRGRDACLPRARL